jgi:ABC-type amino acid transport system permease subunit
MGAEVTMLSYSLSKEADAKRLGAHKFILASDAEQVVAALGRVELTLAIREGTVDVLPRNRGEALGERPDMVDELADAWPATLELTVAALLISAVAGVAAGVISAVSPNSIFDAVARVGSLFGLSMPVFWTGLVLIVVFALWLPWLPVGGMGGPSHLVLPAVTLALPSVAMVARMTRSSVLEVLREDYVRTARAKGVAERLVVIKHALRCSLPDDKETWWTGTAWAASTTYSVGQQVTNDTGPRVYECIVQGISAGSGGPTGTGTAITDGGVTWRYMGLVGYYTCNVPWPDAHTDYCGGPIAVTGCGTQQYTGTIKYGRTIGIPASVNLGSLGLSAAGLMLATCIQKYGMYQRDSTSAGNGNVTLYSENLSGPNATLVNGAMNTDLGSIIVPQLRIMTNQTLDRGATNLNGGGTYPPLLPPVNTALVG